MRITPILAGSAAGLVLAAGSLATLDLATESADAQGGGAVSQAQFKALEARVTGLGQNSSAAQRISKNLNNALGKHVVPEGTLIGAKQPPGVIRQDRGVGGGLPEEVLSAEVRAKLNASGSGGPPGPAGPAGPPGPSTGPAGGDLTGSYPDPKLAALPAARVNSGTFEQPGNNDAITLSWNELFDNPLNYDPFDMHTDAQPERLSAPRDGLYYASAGASWGNNVGGSRLMYLAFQPLSGGERLTTVHHGPPSPGLNSTTISGGALFPMRAGEAVTVIVRQSSGVALGVTPLYFNLAYIGARV